MARPLSPPLEIAVVAGFCTALAILPAVIPVLLPADLAGVLVLAPPLTGQPWTLVTAVYTHFSPGHLLANLLGLLLVGPFVARKTTNLRFHAFFLATGMLSGVAEVLAGQASNTPVAVAGMSGAVFALLGYLLAGNVATRAILSRVDLSPRVQFAIVLVVAVGITLATASPGVALVGHATGLGLGLIAGGLGLLGVRDPRDRGRSLGG
jgi:membrane associated rhomboid family serine protease